MARKKPSDGRIEKSIVVLFDDDPSVYSNVDHVASWGRSLVSSSM